MPKAYIEPVDHGYEFGIMFDQEGREYRFPKGHAVRREDAVELLKHVDEVLDQSGRWFLLGSPPAYWGAIKPPQTKDLTMDHRGATIDSEGILAAFVGLVGHLEDIGVTTRADVGDHLRCLSYSATEQLAPQLLALSECLHRNPHGFSVIDGGKADNDDGPDAA